MVAELVPYLIKLIPRRPRKQGLNNRRWVEDIRGALTVQVIVEYLRIWDLVDDLVLQQDVPDQHKWILAQSTPTPVSLLITYISSDPSNSLHGREFRKVGLRCAVNFSYGLL